MAYTLGDVIKKYNQGDYDAIAGMCGELIERGENVKEAICYTVKASIQMIDNTVPELKKSLTEYLAVALDHFDSLEEIIELEKEVISIMRERELEFHNAALMNFIENPTEEGWETYRTFRSQELLYPFEIQIVFGKKKKVYADKMGRGLSEINDEFEVDYTDIHEQEIKQMQYETGCTIIDNAITYLNENKAGVFERCKSVLLNYMTAVICGNGIIDLSCPKANEVTSANKKEYIQKLLRKAYPINYLLTTSVYPDGNEMPIVKFATDMARTQLGELKEIYDKIKAVDPNYELPPLPEVPSSTTTSSGCYVATAVYGSYDCPQLWTLRRYRDYTLMPTWYGRAFVHTYYAISPTLVKWFGNCSWFKNMFKPKLEKMVKKLNEKGVEDTPYDDLNW